MDILEVFPSKYVKGSDFEVPVQFTITGVSMEALQDGTSKPTVSFAETTQQFILNKTNSLTLASFLGGETTSWPGNKIELYSETVPYQGKMVQSVRVRKPANGAAPVAAVPDSAADESGWE